MGFKNGKAEKLLNFESQPGRWTVGDSNSNIDKPPWQKQSNFTSEASFKAFSKAMTSPRSFLKIATSTCDAMTPFGHTPSTQQWATEMLGLNFFVTSSARFLLRKVASMTPAPSTTARATPKFPSPPLGAKLACFRIVSAFCARTTPQ
jgi:hypothetical protein